LSIVNLFVEIASFARAFSVIIHQLFLLWFDRYRHNNGAGSSPILGYLNRVAAAIYSGLVMGREPNFACFFRSRQFVTAIGRPVRVAFSYLFRPLATKDFMCAFNDSSRKVTGHRREVWL
jgi:hypothetical protein